MLVSVALSSNYRKIESIRMSGTLHRKPKRFKGQKPAMLINADHFHFCDWFRETNENWLRYSRKCVVIEVILNPKSLYGVYLVFLIFKFISNVLYIGKRLYFVWHFVVIETYMKIILVVFIKARRNALSTAF